MPYWLRGGIISLFILIFVLILTLIFFYIYPSPQLNETVNLIRTLFDSIYYPDFISTFLYKGSCHGEGCVFGLLLTLPISYFIIGAIIGWIYGKIKSKKS